MPCGAKVNGGVEGPVVGGSPEWPTEGKGPFEGAGRTASETLLRPLPPAEGLRLLEPYSSETDNSKPVRNE